VAVLLHEKCSITARFRLTSFWPVCSFCHTTRMHSADYDVTKCLFVYYVCLPVRHMPRLYRNINVSSNFFTTWLIYHYSFSMLNIMARFRRELPKRAVEFSVKIVILSRHSRGAYLGNDRR